MSNRKSIQERESTRPVNAFFEESKQTSKKTNKDYSKKTYYLSEEHIKAINLYSAFEEVDKSEIIRNAIESYIPEKYFEMARK